MPQTQPASSETQGILTHVYRTGLKVDGSWHEYAQDCARVDVRPGDTVRLSLDDLHAVLALEIVARGTGTVAPDQMSSQQRELLEKLIDDREGSVEDLDQFIRRFKGKEFASLTKVEARLLIGFFFGREGRFRRRR